MGPREFAQVRQWLGQAFVWSRGEYDRMLRAATAKGLGLEPSEYNAPYPGTTNTTAINIAGLADQPTANGAPAPATPATAPASGPGWKAIVAAGLGGSGLGAGAILLASLLGQQRPQVPMPTVPTVPAKDPHAYEWKVEIFRDKDGKIRERVTPVEPGK